MAADLRARVFGDSHPGTLTVNSNLANSYRAAGDLDRAVSLHEATLTQYERSLGPTHSALLHVRLP
ncbi:MULTISPECIES: tetratricopeptide repeat protein [unclassified Streptomyces]|uniref:tetratricopeptide repeat protein n=1 Tax=unclassified Streptomyces TaxID=2593676 RepID=UPI00278C230E|nr:MULTISPECIES: tetratricopeptide repeat protein [unclassified Streptomyces]